jgi:hypothetical protein
MSMTNIHVASHRLIQLEQFWHQTSVTPLGKRSNLGVGLNLSQYYSCNLMSVHADVVTHLWSKWRLSYKEVAPGS